MHLSRTVKIATTMANRPAIQRGGDYAKAPVPKKPVDAHPTTPSKSGTTGGGHEAARAPPVSVQRPLVPPPAQVTSSSGKGSVQVDAIRHAFSRSTPLLVADRTMLVRRTRLEISRTPSTARPQTPTLLTISRAGCVVCELSNALDMDAETSVVVGSEYVIRSGDAITLSFDVQAYADVRVDLLATF
jgi:hypothetical protein